MSDSSSHTLSAQETSKDGIRARIKQRGSRLLSLLSRGHSSTGERSSDSDGPPKKKQRVLSSRPAFTEKVTGRLSLGNPTVIRRSNLRSRPSVRVVAFKEISPAVPSSKDIGNADNSSDPSSSPSSGASPAATQSTPPTSNSPTSTDSADKRADKPVGVQTGCLSPEDLTAKIEVSTGHQTPSILTVEAASNAKVFFETYYERLYADGGPRAQRQRELERYMSAFPLASGEKAMIWKNWTAQERDYLRQYRALMAYSLLDPHGRDISGAGFETVKILGQGSFGVVRLVRKISKDHEAGFSDRDGRCIEAHPGDSQSRLDKGPRQCMVGVKREVYAMKVICKSVMIRNGQEAHIRAERDFLVAAKSQWSVPLIASFEDARCLYLVMDYMVGGDFLGLLIRRSLLPEHIAQQYVAEMVLCVEEAHRLGWIHRDIKPDNFLISESGHLKMSDFGLSFDGHWSHNQAYYNENRYDLAERLGIQINGDTHDQEEAQRPPKKTQQTSGETESFSPTPSERVLDWRDRTQRQKFAKSIVGTSQYMAPEVVRGDYYDGRCDYWSIGIILYECLYGRTPFASKDRNETKWKIHYHNKTLRFPMRSASDKLISAEAVDLIHHLLQEKEHRLSCGQYRVNDVLPGSKDPRGLHVYPDDASNIKSHPFFEGIRWDALHRTSPPFIPKVRGWEDTRYFDDARPFEGGDVLSTSKSVGSTDDNSQAKDLKKPKRRARDKILRDPELGKTALYLRKKGAFAGYTYRRPKPVERAFVPERGRPYLSV